MITVHVPYVDGGLNRGTWWAVHSRGGPARFVWFDRQDPYQYGRFLRRLWEQGQDFIICEQDVIPTLRQFDQLEVCPKPWCSFGYESADYGDGPMLGLVRFRAVVLAEYPMAADIALHHGAGKELEVGWWNVDVALANDLNIRGIPWHRHTPPVRHDRRPEISDVP